MPQFFTDIVIAVRPLCLAIYKDLHICFTETKDTNEKKRLIELSLFIGKIFNSSIALNALYKASVEIPPLTFQEINLKELIEEIITDRKPITYYKQLVIDYKLAIDIPDLIISEQYRLQQILKCLVNNSIRHANNIFLTVNFFKSNEENKQEIETKNFVIQIICRSTYPIYSQDAQTALKNQQKAFNEQFTSLKTIVNKNCDLLGIDLCLVKYLTGGMDGKIEMEVDEKGSSLICDIPVLLPAANKNDIRWE